MDGRIEGPVLKDRTAQYHDGSRVGWTRSGTRAATSRVLEVRPPSIGTKMGILHPRKLALGLVVAILVGCGGREALPATATVPPPASPATPNAAASVGTGSSDTATIIKYFEDSIAAGEECAALIKAGDKARLRDAPFTRGVLVPGLGKAVTEAFLAEPAPSGLGPFKLAAIEARGRLFMAAQDCERGVLFLTDPMDPGALGGEDAGEGKFLPALRRAVETLKAAAPQ
jgi:hypothetical protein